MKHARDDYDRIQDPAKLIPDDEPVFLLRGQDILAPLVLDYYASLVAGMGGDQQIVTKTTLQAHKMRQWPRRRMPDISPPPPKVP